jgi:hypothetical protein
MEEEDQKQFIYEIDMIIKSRIEFINRNYLAVRNAFQTEYNWPEMDTLREEITLALIFGLAQAAITLTNHLLENLLKNTLIIYELKQNPQIESRKKDKKVADLINITTPARRKYANEKLSKNIDTACRLRLITKEEKKQLHEYRKVFRNAYGHSDTDKIFGNKDISTQSLKMQNDNFVLGEQETLRLADSIFSHGLAQAFQAREDAVPYFIFMDGVVRNICSKFFTHSSVADTGHSRWPAIGQLKY